MKLSLIQERDIKEAVNFIEKIFNKKDAKGAKWAFELSINKNKEKKLRVLEYYFLKKNSKIIAITGIYSHKTHPCNIAWLGWFGVHPNYRGTGLGTRLLKWSENKAFKLGFSYFYIVADRSALNFYLNQDYKKSKSKKLKKLYFPKGCTLIYKKLLK